MISKLFRKKSTKDILIVGFSTYKLLCAYSSTQLFQYFPPEINTYFPVTSKEGPELFYLNLRIIQSPHGISIEHPSHTNETILTQWFQDITKTVNSSTTLFEAYINFELAL